MVGANSSLAGNHNNNSSDGLYTQDSIATLGNADTELKEDLLASRAERGKINQLRSNLANRTELQSPRDELKLYHNE